MESVHLRWCRPFCSGSSTFPYCDKEKMHKKKPDHSLSKTKKSDDDSVVITIIDEDYVFNILSKMFFSDITGFIMLKMTFLLFSGSVVLEIPRRRGKKLVVENAIFYRDSGYCRKSTIFGKSYHRLLNSKMIPLYYEQYDTGASSKASAGTKTVG